MDLEPPRSMMCNPAKAGVFPGVGAALVALTASLVLAVVPAGAQDGEPVTRETIDRWMVELSNWGRWGPDDQLGTLNLITPERRVEAARLVTRGVSVSLAHDYLKERAPDVSSPLVQEMRGVDEPGTWVTDFLEMAYHGHAHSHLDALCHMWHEGKAYRGVLHSEAATAEGCLELGVTALKDGVVGRGVLMDIARLRGVDYLEPGTPIFAADLEEWERVSGVRVQSGDVLLVRAGRWARRAEEGPWPTAALAAGLHASAVPWLRERGVAMIGSDYTNDVLPHGIEGVVMPVHQLTLIALGMPIFDNLDLEAVARAAAEAGRWEFLFVAAPLRIPGGTGSPLNPLAIF
jgi:kynurenine formamidase